MITVGKPYFPDRKTLAKYIDRIYENGWLTNNGPLVRELTERLEDYLGVKNLLLVANGTLALQIAYQALGIQGKAITTPFSFVATASSLKWEGIEPVFADIDPETFCIDPAQVEAAITPEVRALVPVHVFGNACEVERLQAIAEKQRLKIVYDGAHAFGVRYKGESLLNWGDATTLSFHATKLFHTAEGGAIVFKDREVYEKAKLAINFGIDGPDSVVALGINAKMSELHAAMGLAVLDDIALIIEERARICARYSDALGKRFGLQRRNSNCTDNHGYFPILLPNEAALLNLKNELTKEGIVCRRYFYPSLDSTVPFNSRALQVQARHIAERVLCLPVSPGTDAEVVVKAINLNVEATGA